MLYKVDDHVQCQTCKYYCQSMDLCGYIDVEKRRRVIADDGSYIDPLYCDKYIKVASVKIKMDSKKDKYKGDWFYGK